MAGDSLAFGAFRARPHEHGMGKIGADDARRAHPSESKGKVAGATAEIKDHSILALEYGLKTVRGALAPKTIEVKRQEMIEQVITGSDLREHLANFSRGVSFGVGAFMAQSYSARVTSR